MVYCAEKDPNDPTKRKPNAPITPVHSCVSNGDGTFTTKNGTVPKITDATPMEAVGGYIDSNSSDKIICWAECYEKN